MANILRQTDSTWSWKDGSLHIALAGHGFEVLESRPAI
jgi:hypothetical protein